MTTLSRVRDNFDASENTQVLTNLQTSCNKSLQQTVDKLCSHCSKLLEQVRNKLLTYCNKLGGTIRFVTRLFQQDWYSHDITILLQQYCVVNFVTILLQQVCIRVVSIDNLGYITSVIMPWSSNKQWNKLRDKQCEYTLLKDLVRACPFLNFGIWLFLGITVSSWTVIGPIIV